MGVNRRLVKSRAQPKTTQNKPKRPPTLTRAVEHVDPVVGVFAGVAVDDVHQDHHAQAVGLVNQGLWGGFIGWGVNLGGWGLRGGFVP